MGSMDIYTIQGSSLNVWQLNENETTLGIKVIRLIFFIDELHLQEELHQSSILQPTCNMQQGFYQLYMHDVVNITWNINHSSKSNTFGSLQTNLMYYTITSEINSRGLQENYVSKNLANKNREHGIHIAIQCFKLIQLGGSSHLMSSLFYIHWVWALFVFK